MGLGLASAPANAACTPDPASSGDTVTCSGNTPGGFQAGVGVDGLTVNVQAGATINVAPGVAISVNDFNAVTNQGTITGSALSTGIVAQDFNTITNIGTIIGGSTSTGIRAGVNSTIVNAASGVIIVEDHSQGISVAGNSTVTNAGQITLTLPGPGAGIEAIGDDNIVSNLAGATIAVFGEASGVSILGNRALVNNAGTIDAGPFSAGIDVFGSDAVITSGGLISIANRTTAIQAQGDRALITHSGTINGTFEGAGVTYDGSSGTINNSGRILLGDNSVGIAVIGDSNVITNNGNITVRDGSAAGIDVISVSGSNSIVNTGAINVGAGAIGIRLNGNGTIFNSGTISAAAGFAAIELCGCGNSSLTLGPGSVINGLVLGNGTDTFQLGGVGNDSLNLSLIGAGQQYDGFATFNKVGTATWSVTGTGAQDWNVLGGTLAVNGVINGVVTVNAGGTLGGTGTIDNVAVNGGRLAPGNSIGTLNVAGSLTFTAASSYIVEISGASSDLTRVTGVATLSGAGVVVAPIGTVTKQYTILTATGGVAGTFDPVVSRLKSEPMMRISCLTRFLHANRGPLRLKTLRRITRNSARCPFRRRNW